MKNNSVLWAGAFALAAAIYLPAANATATDSYTLAQVTYGQGLGGIHSDLNPSSAFTDFLVANTDEVNNTPQAFDVKFYFTAAQFSAVSWSLQFNDNSYSNLQLGVDGVNFGSVTDATTPFFTAQVGGATTPLQFADPTNYAYALNNGLNYIEISGNIISGDSGLSGTVQITPSPVPEPEQWGMLLLGLPMLSWMVRRKQVA